VHVLENDFDEAKWVVRKIGELLAAGERPEEIALFYRTHAQSRLFEDMLRANRVPYKIFGGLRFYDRAEIKNALSYLKLIANPLDNVALARVINVPTRGIGKTSVESLRNFAFEQGMSMSEAMGSLGNKKIAEFDALIQRLRVEAEKMPVRDFYSLMLEETGYLASLKKENDIEAATRLENLQELASAIADYEAHAETPNLAGFLEEVALYTDQDRGASDEAAVTLMTIHSAKGLEYLNVFLVGLEEELFPSIRGDSFAANPDEIEEERRLCYVGMTRAREKLFMTSSHVRRVFGIRKVRRLSRFIGELPQNEIHLEDHAPTFQSAGRGLYDPDSYDSSYDSFESRSPFKAAPDFSEFYEAPAEDENGFKVGEKVKHPDYGSGVVVAKQGSRDALKLSIRFSVVGTKKFLAKFAPLERE
jgi:DNA helicase II / ATP-dependent DNA helicase PcrA